MAVLLMQAMGAMAGSCASASGNEFARDGCGFDSRTLHNFAGRPGGRNTYGDAVSCRTGFDSRLWLLASGNKFTKIMENNAIKQLQDFIALAPENSNYFTMAVNRENRFLEEIRESVRQAMKWTPANITEDLRQMGRDDFEEGRAQSYGLRCWCPNSLALKRWLEGWEQAELDAYCDEMAEKDKWLVEQFKRELGL